MTDVPGGASDSAAPAAPAGHRRSEPESESDSESGADRPGAGSGESAKRARARPGSESSLQCMQFTHQSQARGNQTRKWHHILAAAVPTRADRRLGKESIHEESIAMITHSMPWTSISSANIFVINRGS